jgi:hypothetical protein
MNKDQIRNPHLIYPGYVILLDRVRGQLSISSGESSSQTVSGTGTTAGAVKLSPRARTESLAKLEIPSIPPAAIEPFLRRPLVIEPDGLDRAPTIVGTEADRVILAAGNKAYVRGISDSKEDTWYVYRRGGPLVDPDTNQTLGFEAIYLGTAQVTRSGDPTTIVLSSAVQEVGAGDKLVAAGNSQPPSYAPHPPASQVRGRVMSIYGGLGKVGEAGQHSIITINRGKANGLEIGHVLALYSAGEVVRDVTDNSKIKLPDERSGLAFVFRVFDRVSYALVMHVTRPVSPLDVVQNP